MIIVTFFNPGHSIIRYDLAEYEFLLSLPRFTSLQKSCTSAMTSRTEQRHHSNIGVLTALKQTPTNNKTNSKKPISPSKIRAQLSQWRAVRRGGTQQFFLAPLRLIQHFCGTNDQFSSFGLIVIMQCQSIIALCVQRKCINKSFRTEENPLRNCAYWLTGDCV